MWWEVVSREGGTKRYLVSWCKGKVGGAKGFVYMGAKVFIVVFGHILFVYYVQSVCGRS